MSIQALAHYALLSTRPIRPKCGGGDPAVQVVPLVTRYPGRNKRMRRGRLDFFTLQMQRWSHATKVQRRTAIRQAMASLYIEGELGASLVKHYDSVLQRREH